jgi:hypothetical protein
MQYFTNYVSGCGRQISVNCDDDVVVVCDAVQTPRSIPTFQRSIPEDGDSMLLRNVGIYLRVNTVPQPRTTSSSFPP